MLPVLASQASRGINHWFTKWAADPGEAASAGSDLCDDTGPGNTGGRQLTTHNLVSGFIGPWLRASLPLSALRVLRSVLTVYWFHCLPLIYGSINSVYTTPRSPYFWSMPHTTLDNCDLSRRMLWEYFNDDSDIAAPASPCSWSNIYPEALRIRRMSLLDIRDRDNGGWWSSLGQWEGSTAWEWPIRGRVGR